MPVAQRVITVAQRMITQHQHCAVCHPCGINAVCWLHRAALLQADVPALPPPLLAAAAAAARTLAAPPTSSLKSAVREKYCLL